jgi:hypothetical protein
MFLRSCFVTAFIFSLLSFGYAQSAAPASPSGPATSAAVEILSPKPGAKLTTNFVQVKYGVANAASASSSPTFRLRLDAADPVDTTDTSYTFTGLAPGTHRVSIAVVDANGTPVSGTQSEIKFTVAPPVAAPSSAPPRGQNTGTLTAFNVIPRAAAATSVKEMQSDPGDITSPLLLLLAGVIIGGVISAVRTHTSGRASK